MARYEYLKQHIRFPQPIEDISCSDFEKWLDLEQIESVSLVFASGYFRNPASFFGHPVLKFNGNEDTSSLLDLSLNNGAVVPDNENPVVYVIKGVFGGYKSSFSDTRFYQLNHAYAENDLRDLWHYKINLSKQELTRLAHFSWELLSHKFTYRFFTKNCSYFLEELFAYALGRRISTVNRFYTVPSTTFMNLVKNPEDGPTLIESITREPSRQSRFREKFSALSDTEKRAVRDHVSNKTYKTKGVESELRVIDTLTDYYLFLQARTKSAAKKQELTSARTNLFRQRLGLAKKDNLKWPDNSANNPPHLGNPPSLIGMSLIHNEKFGGGLKMRLRPASYDVLDLDGSHAKNSRLNMFNTEVAILDDKLELLRFDLVDVETLNMSQTGLPKDGGLGWGFKIGAQRAALDCFDCLVAYTSGSIRKGKQLTNEFTGYLHGEATYHSSYLASNARLGFAVGIIGQPTPVWKSHLKIGRRIGISGEQNHGSQVMWENRFGNRTEWNSTFSVLYDGNAEVSFGIGRYW